MQRNSNSLIGSSLEVRDGVAGEVVDVYFDDQTWIIVYLIVKTGSWPDEHKVFLSTYHLRKGMPPPGTGLRSIHAIAHYRIETTDSHLGKLIDFIIDDKTWQIDHLVIELHPWLERKKVLLACKNIKNIRWDTSLVMVDISGSKLKSCRSYGPSEFEKAF
jgi:uncharacterized protein YrrD